MWFAEQINELVSIGRGLCHERVKDTLKTFDDLKASNKTGPVKRI